MKQYESAFLGLILAGVVMMVIGLGLMVHSGRMPDSHAMLADRATGFASGTGGSRTIRQ